MISMVLASRKLSHVSFEFGIYLQHLISQTCCSLRPRCPDFLVLSSPWAPSGICPFSPCPSTAGFPRHQGLRQLQHSFMLSRKFSEFCLHFPENLRIGRVVEAGAALGRGLRAGGGTAPGGGPNRRPLLLRRALFPTRR